MSHLSSNGTTCLPQVPHTEDETVLGSRGSPALVIESVPWCYQATEVQAIPLSRVLSVSMTDP